MMQIGLIGIGAGAAGALLFASVISGSWLSLFLFYLAPLPLMIAGIGWSHWAALIGGIGGAVALGTAFGWVFFVAFLAGAGIPAWWLGYLAMLARPAGGNGGAPSLEWYPPGRLVAWTAILAALVVLAAIPFIGLDATSFHAALTRTLTHLLQIESGSAPGTPLTLPGVSQPQRLIDFMAEVIPPAAAVIAMLTNACNLWLAARVVKFSGRLSRPWPELAAMRLPRELGMALAVAIALSFVGGMLGILAGVVAASLLMAYGILGFAVLHALTRGIAARGFILGASYASVLVFGWPMLMLCLLGLIDAIFDLRGRAARRRPPPT
jgi:Predicted membrane protein (DUF2232)